MAICVEFGLINVVLVHSKVLLIAGIKQQTYFQHLPGSPTYFSPVRLFSCLVSV